MDNITPDITTAFRDASRWAREGLLEQAESKCEEILRTQSNHAGALLLRGAIALETRRSDRAVASIREAIEQSPRQPLAYLLLGDAQLDLHCPGEALTSYDAALSLNATLELAHFGRGNALLDLQRAEEAVRCFDAALRLEPQYAEALFNRGNALQSLRRTEAALDSFERAIALRPSYAAAHNNRGSALLSLRRLEDALASFEAAVGIEPTFDAALSNRGTTLLELTRPREALETFDRLLAHRPDAAEAHHYRGLALRALERPEEAITSFDRAIALRGDYVEAHCGRGDALLDMGHAEDALAAHTHALSLGPGSAAAHMSRGNSLCSLKRFAEAVDCFNEAVRLDPNDSAAHYNRGNALMQWRRPEEAAACFERAAQLKPHYGPALRRHADALLTLNRPHAAVDPLRQLLRSHPDFDYAPGALLHAQLCSADWSMEPAGRAAVHEAVLAGNHADLPFSFLSVTDCAAAQLHCARANVAHRCEPTTPLWAGERYRHERIRVAYVSADFRAHAVSYLLAGVWERHDRQRFEVIAISLRPEEASAMGQRVKSAFSQFIDVSARSDLEAARLIRALEIDIAVDLIGLTAGLRPQILAYRPAPVQVNYLGFPGTMGAPFIDYILADHFVIPKAREHHYSEHVVRLPYCFQANDDQRLISEHPLTRADAGLPEESFVFCCFNNTHKINPAMFDIWMRLLERLPRAALWLLSTDDAVRAHLRREAVLRGVDAERLVFAPRMPYADHLRRLKLADLFLDTLPFNAGTTASDALWAGLPVLTCAGDAFAARMAGSLLRSAGLPELITDRADQYEAKALELAQRPQELDSLRRRLEQNRRSMPAFDTDRSRRYLEAAYEQMWRRYQQGERPAGFDLQD